jgi:predicted RND superfamily exporter protein
MAAAPGFIPARIEQMTFVLRLIQLLLRHRLATALVLLASIAVSAYAARNIEIRFQYKDLYDYPGNPRLPLLARYTEEFGDPGGFVVLLIESHDVFQPDVLQYIDSVTRELETKEEFEQIRSLTNARAIRAVGDAVESGPILHEIPRTPEEVQQARATALGSSLLVRRIVSSDSTVTAVLAEMKDAAAFTTIPRQQQAINTVARVMRQFPPPAETRIQVTGAPLVEVETTRALIDDQRLLTPLVFLVLITALGLTFRSIHGIVLPLVAVTVSLIWTGGVFSLLHHPIDMVGSTIPTTLLVYGVVDPIFVYTRYLDKLPFSRTPEQAVLEAMRELLLPCFVTSLTTALGFAAFITATLPMIKYFGVVVAVGVLFAFLTTITVLPLLLVSVAPARIQLEKPWIAGVTDSLMAWIWQTARTRPELMVALALSLLIAGAGAARGMPIVTEYVGTLPKGRVQDSVRLLEQKLSGVVRVAIYLEGEEDSMKRPEVLHAIEAIDRVAEQQPNVTSSISLADLIADTNQAFLGGDPKEHHVPDDPSLISQYLALIDPGDLSDFVTSDYSHSHLRILVSDHGSQAVWRLRDVLQREIDARLTPLGIRGSLTGHGVVAYYDADNVVVEVLWGFLVAFSVIIAVQLVMFRSLRVALISIVPNIVPICACLLVMRAIGLKMRVDNSLVLCVSVGGLFNTTIHIVARIMQQLRNGATDPDVIVGRALAAVGPPSLYTAAILSLGFAVMGASRFPGLQVLGLLCLVTLMSGFIADATLTTSFFRMFFNWNSVRFTGTVRPEAVLGSMATDEEAVP